MAGVKGRSGGARVGAGRKRRDASAAWLAGGAKKPKAGPRAIPAITDVVPVSSDAPTCPKDVPADIAAVWRDLAPHAIKEGTLSHRTALAFRVLCQNVVLLDKLAAAPLTCAGPDHRGMLARVEVGWARFRLIPDGKPTVAEEAPVDEWAEFDQPLTVLKGGKA